MDVDATTFASVLIPGKAALMTSYIQERVGGDLFPLGQVTSGLEFLQSQAGGFSAMLERVQ